MGTSIPSPMTLWVISLCVWFGSGFAFSIEESVTRDELSADVATSVTSTTNAISASPESVTNASPSTKDIFQAVKNAMGNNPNETGTTQSELFENNQGESTRKYIGRMLMSLAFVILLALSIAWAMKRYVLKNRSLGGGHIQLLTSYNLSQKSRVHLLKVGEEFLLVGEGGNNLTLISRVNLSPSEVNHSFTEELEEESTPQPATNTKDFAPFHERLSQWQNSLDDQNLNQEVKASLLLLGGLSQRLRRKGGDGNA